MSNITRKAVATLAAVSLAAAVNVISLDSTYAGPVTPSAPAGPERCC